MGGGSQAFGHPQLLFRVRSRELVGTGASGTGMSRIPTGSQHIQSKERSKTSGIPSHSVIPVDNGDILHISVF